MCMRGPAFPSGKSMRGPLSNSEPPAYPGLAGLLCTPACFPKSQPLPSGTTDSSAFHVLPKMFTVFNKQNTCWGTECRPSRVQVAGAGGAGTRGSGNGEHLNALYTERNWQCV